MDLTLLILAFLAVFILFQLYNVLGRRVGFKPEDAQNKPSVVNAIQEAGLLEKKPDTPKAEGLKIANLDQLKSRDANFNEFNFLETARETYESIVLAFNRGELDSVKGKLSDEVYKVFTDAVDQRVVNPNAAKLDISFVGSPKADFDAINLNEEGVSIRMRFLSELLYQAHQDVKSDTSEEQALNKSDTLTLSEATADTLEQPQIAVIDAPRSKTRKTTTAKLDQIKTDLAKTYRRTAEYWTFYRSAKSKTSSWILQKVEAAKA